MTRSAMAIMCAGLSLASARLNGQAVYDSPTGRVEVLGLRHWTLQMLRDSIRRYVPGQDLHDAACMVTLRDSLHFVEASVDSYTMEIGGATKRVFLSIKVVEPDQASTVQWNAAPNNEFASMLPDYAPIILGVSDSTGAVWRARIFSWAQRADSAGRSAALTRARPADRADGERLYAFLADRQKESDRVRAMRTLARNGFWANRMVAATILENFGARDSTWFALVHALRDPHDAVRESASVTLNVLPSRPIDWRTAVADLRLLLNGTGLGTIQQVFDLLARTKVAPELAPALLHENSGWLLDLVGAEAPMVGESAHRLLVQLNGGRDLGTTRAAWAPWIKTL